MLYRLTFATTSRSRAAVARRAHNPKVGGSNPPFATTQAPKQEPFYFRRGTVMSGFTVAIIGRPNVGKSTFFNRLLDQRRAIVDDISGVTRDRQYGVADWNGKTFNMIDTGGFVPESEDIFEQEIKKQVLIALEEANAVIFMMDIATGITALDDAMADLLRRILLSPYFWS